MMEAVIPVDPPPIAKKAFLGQHVLYYTHSMHSSLDRKNETIVYPRLIPVSYSAGLGDIMERQPW